MGRPMLQPGRTVALRQHLRPGDYCRDHRSLAVRRALIEPAALEGCPTATTSRSHGGSNLWISVSSCLRGKTVTIFVVFELFVPSCNQRRNANNAWSGD